MTVSVFSYAGAESIPALLVGLVVMAAGIALLVASLRQGRRY